MIKVCPISKMKKRVMILLLGLIASLHLYSTDFKRGFIVLPNSDSIKGYIYKSNEEKLNLSIQFKRRLEVDSVTLFLPQQLKSFGFENSNKPFYAVEYIFKKDSVQTKHLRFGKLVYNGQSRLYRLEIPYEEQLYTYESRCTYAFVVEKDGCFYTLSQREVVKLQEDNSKINFANSNYLFTIKSSILHKDYVGVLHYLCADCPALYYEIENLSFAESSVIALLKKYEKRCK